MARGQGDLFGMVKSHDDPAVVGDAVMRAVRSVASRHHEFTTDEVEAELTDWTIAEPRQIGPAMLRARAAGWIEPTDRTRPTTNPRAHKRPKAVWRSRLKNGS